MKIAVFWILGIFLGILALSSAKHQETSHASASSGTQEKGQEVKGKTYAEHHEGHTAEKSSKHDQESGKHGSETSDLHKSKTLEKGGKKHKHFHADKHQTFHKQAGGSAHGATFEEGSKRHKGNYKKGFLEKFHKDELTKHDSFNTKGEKTGSYQIFGKGAAKFGKQTFAKKSGGTFKNLKTEAKHGKNGKKAGGRKSSDKKGHKSSKSSKSNYSKGQKHGKKGGKQYKYTH